MTILVLFGYTVVFNLFLGLGRYNRLPPFVSVITTEVVFGVWWPGHPRVEEWLALAAPRVCPVLEDRAPRPQAAAPAQARRPG
ncbi:MAG: hypothetical protein WDO13_11200 [Verrucomicrobiota bacterium]